MKIPRVTTGHQARLTTMTSKDMKAVVDRIKADPEFAKRAYDDPEAVLPLEFDLDPAQWQAVHRALARDVDQGDEDVAGFAVLDWRAHTFPNLDALVSPRDAATGQASGRRQHKPFVITDEADKPSP